MTSTPAARLYLDSNVLIYFLEEHSDWGERAGMLMAQGLARDLDLVTGDAAMSEVLVGAHRARDPEIVTTVTTFFTQGPVRVLSHTHEDFADAARIRARHGGRLPDALHLATAHRLGCVAMVSHDAGMARLPALPVLRLDEFDDGWGREPS
ncbi:MAG: type II toxin-antitoxin system VapC family toxin [Actinomycetota bacterium]|nr:type II toxin-antitoxin system VapC family toxin [Actinomycetota bacterium]